MTRQEWETKFEESFSELEDRWNFEIVREVQETGWLQTRYKGMATFECSTATCNNRWTSVNGGAIFYYRLSRCHNRRCGNVKLFLGGQKCKKCDHVFETAEWSNSGIKGAITKLLDKVKQKFYGVLSSAAENTYIPADMSAPHQTNLCQFCALGVCQYAQQNDTDSIAGQLELLDLDDNMHVGFR